MECHINLLFFFHENEYFSNEKLLIHVILSEDDEQDELPKRIESSEIEWKDNMNITIE